MPASRTKAHHSQFSESGPSSNKGISSHKRNVHPPGGAYKARSSGNEAILGVQKLKAGLRQTRRLLAKVCPSRFLFAELDMMTS